MENQVCELGAFAAAVPLRVLNLNLSLQEGTLPHMPYDDSRE